MKIHAITSAPTASKVGKQNRLAPSPQRRTRTLRIGVALLLVLLALLTATLLDVRAGEATVVTRFGDPVRVLLNPGLS